MTGYGRRGKPTPGFPRHPQPLEIAARFPHSRSRDEQWKSGKPKAAFPLSHCRCCTQSTDLKTKTWRPAARSSAPPFRLILQLENATNAREYGRLAASAGAGKLLVQRAIRRFLHCDFTQSERDRAFNDLVEWVNSGQKPAGDELSRSPADVGRQWTEPLRPDDPGNN